MTVFPSLRFGLALIATCLAAISLTAKAETSPTGKTYDVADQGLYYQYNSNSTEFILVDADYTENLVIPATVNDIPVTQVAENAFTDRIDLETVTLGENIKTVESRAFYNSTGITAVDWSAITNKFTIGYKAFYNTSVGGVLTLSSNGKFANECFSKTKITKVIYEPGTSNPYINDCPELTEVEIREGITEVSGYNYCPKITSIYIPASVTLLGGFSHCEALTTVEFAEGSQLTTLSEGTFSYTSIKSLHLPDSVKYLYRGGQFTGTLFDDIWVPPLVDKFQASANRVHYTSVDRIWEINPSGFGDFERHPTIYVDGEQITELNAPTTVTNISLSYIGGVTKITVPNSVKANSFGARYLPDLEEIEIGAGATALNYLDHNPKLRTLKVNPKNKLSTYSDDGINFEGCSSLESISLSGITKISSFSNCTSLISGNTPHYEDSSCCR